MSVSEISLDRGNKMIKKLQEDLTILYENWRYIVLPNFWYDHISWRIHHYIWQERCETCQNWHFCGKSEGRSIGNCDIDTMYWQDYHGHCSLWNLDINETNYEQEDGCERRFITPSGNIITQISRGGVWQFYYNGEPEWWPK